MIPVLRPTADQWTKDKLMSVIESGWWGAGPVVAEFEKEFAKRIGVRHAIAVSSGTAALDLCLKAHFPGNKGGELITSPMTFVADAIVGPWNGMRVTFADIHRDTLCLEPEEIEFNEDTRAIIAVHSHGRMVNMSRLKDRIDTHEKKYGYRVLVIEDCAHAMHTPTAGLHGDVAIWSFQAVKTLPAGDGGMVTTNNDAIAQTIRNMTWLGIEKSTFARTKGTGYSWDYDIIHDGQKSYMNDINAALALGGLRRIDEIIDRRQRVQVNYNAAFQDLPGVRVPIWSHTVQYYTLETEHRDAIGETLAKAGIATSVHFKPLHLMTYWKDSARNPMPVADRVWKKLLSLPVHDGLSWDDQTFIIETFQNAVWDEWKKAGR